MKIQIYSGFLCNLKRGVVEEVDLDIIYDDDAFNKRGEQLNWRRFSNDQELQAAVASIVTEATPEQHWDELMLRAGFLRCQREISADHTITSVYRSPFLTADSMVHRLGANFSPNGRPKVGARFDASGRFTNFFKPWSTVCNRLTS
jgi:hypothetical protein